MKTQTGLVLAAFAAALLLAGCGGEENYSPETDTSRKIMQSNAPAPGGTTTPGTNAPVPR